MFKNEDGSTASPWTAIQGRVWAVPNDEDGNSPSVKQFSPSSPAPYLDQIKGYASSSPPRPAFPPPTSASNRQSGLGGRDPRGEARLVKRAERRQVTSAGAWLEVGAAGPDGPRRDASLRTSARGSRRWRDAATPTRSAAPTRR
jgi:hypothetical protein